MTVRDPALREVVGRQLYANLVAREDSNVILPQPARDMRVDLVSVLQFDGELRIRKGGHDRPFHDNCIFLRQRHLQL